MTSTFWTNTTMTTAMSAPASAVPATAEVTAEILTSFADAKGLAAQWDLFIADVGGNTSATFDWCRIWWEHFSARRSLRIFLFRAQNRLVGIMPMFLEHPTLLAGRARIAKIVGCDHTINICQPPLHPKYAAQILALLFLELLGPQRCDAVWLGPVSDHCHLPQQLTLAVKDIPDNARILFDRTLNSHSIFQLPASRNAYMTDYLSAQERSTYKRRLKRLSEAHDVSFQLLRDPHETITEFQTLINLFNAKWRRLGQRGYFGDFPQAEAFHRSLLLRMAQLDRVRLLRIQADRTTVALNYCLAFAGVYTGLFSVRALGQPWDRYSVGSISLIKVIEAAIDENAPLIDAGAGHFDYKTAKGAKEAPLRSFLITSHRPLAILKTRIAFRLSRLIHLFYYRLWFLRLAPRLPWTRPPICRAWLRSRY